MPIDPAFALALLRVEGVGRGTANRLLARFPTPDALSATPREQVLVRLSGTPRAAAVVERVGERAAMEEGVARAREELQALSARRVDVLAGGHPHWPAGVDDIVPAQRPVLIWAYGNTAALIGPTLAILGGTPLPPGPYEVAQQLAARLLAAGGTPVVGLRPGFDVALHRLAAGQGSGGRPCVAVASCGLSRIEGSVRTSATAVVRAAGVMISPFPMEHGPFDHDDGDRALLQSALARVTAAFAPAAGAAEGRALTWALAPGSSAGQARRPAFYSGDPLPEFVGARSLGEPGAMQAAVDAALGT